MRIKNMKNKIMFGLIIIVYFLSVKIALAEVANKILAVVNDEVITNQELNDFLSPLYVQYEATYKGKELEEKIAQAQKEMLNQLIDDKLILQEAKKENIIVSDNEIEEKIEELKQRFTSPELFLAALEQQNLTLNKLEGLYRDQLMIKELVNRQVRFKVAVDPLEITRYYQSHLEEFKEPESVHLSNILIKTKDRQDSDAKSEAEGILKSLKEGADFAQLAKEHSQGQNAAQGGDMGFVFKGQLLKEVDEVIFKLNPGEISGVVKTDLGYHILKVHEKRSEQVKPLTAVQAEINEALSKEKFEERFNEWIGKLKKHAYVAIK